MIGGPASLSSFGLSIYGKWPHYETTKTSFITSHRITS